MDDRRFMAAAIRLSERHVGLTGTNPSVATLIVRDDGAGPVIVGRGITARGGRPHAETEALAQAGPRAVGATAYVTLEPCAHNGRTPPCADALVAAGIARVVVAVPDPDPRVDGRGLSILRAGGLSLRTDVLRTDGLNPLSNYLVRAARKRPEVTLKMAVSRDGMIGRRGAGQVSISGAVSNAQTHLVRARHDAILVGVGTVLEDDPALTCRLAGLADRSPLRIVLDARLETPLRARLVTTARQVPTALVVAAGLASADRSPFAEAGCEFVACELVPDTTRVALPELLEDLAARGHSSLLVEGGARIAESFLADDLVDRIILVEGEATVGPGGVPAPVTSRTVPDGFRQTRQRRLGTDLWREYQRG